MPEHRRLCPWRRKQSPLPSEGLSHRKVPRPIRHEMYARDVSCCLCSQQFRRASNNCCFSFHTASASVWAPCSRRLCPPRRGSAESASQLLAHADGLHGSRRQTTVSTAWPCDGPSRPGSADPVAVSARCRTARPDRPQTCPRTPSNRWTALMPRGSTRRRHSTDGTMPCAWSTVCRNAPSSRADLNRRGRDQRPCRRHAEPRSMCRTWWWPGPACVGSAACWTHPNDCSSSDRQTA